MEKVTRRNFIAGTGLTLAGGALASDEKIVDGGFADVSEPGIPERAAPLFPPGAKSRENFTTRCTGCQLCVSACPSHVLRPSRDPKRFLQPEMGFEKGYCRPECVKCSRVCPAGAILPVQPREKNDIHIGHAVWHKDRCLSAQEGVTCSACQRHCPVRAILMVPMDPAKPNSPKVPLIDKLKCIGCGACEHLCAARPLPAITVKGFDVHRHVRPMRDEDALAEAVSLLRKDKASVVLVKGGVLIAGENGRGIGPLLTLLDGRAKDLKGACVVDKVIGRAAASICVAGGASRVYGLLMSEPAAAFLKKHGIAASAEKMTPQIMNRKKDGLCPLESSVKDLSEPGEMIKAIRAERDRLLKERP